MGHTEELNLKELAQKRKPKGTIEAVLSCDKDHRLSVDLGNEYRGVLSCGLVLIDSKQKDRRIYTESEQIQNVQIFSLKESLNELCEPGVSWLAYVFFEDDGELIFKRLKQKGEAICLKPTEDTILGGSRLWKDESVRYLGILGETTLDQQEWKLVPFVNERKNTLTLKLFTARELEAKQVDNLWHRNKEMNWNNAKFDFSVVMAVYTCEDYLEETLESIIQQDIGFEEHIQLILVDDGSKDSSGDICDTYAKRYPLNIKVIHKKNGGAASARNEGLKYATGRYVNFCDSDDILSLNTFSSVKDFFDKKYDETDVVTIPIHFFEAQEGEHWQNYKFKKGSRIINLWTEYTASDMSTAASFIRREALEGIMFDSSLPNGEDLKVVAQVLMKKMTLGVVADCIYWYRRRATGNSLINTSKMKKSWYFEYFDNLVFFFEKYCKQKFGYMPEYIQHTLMMDLQWRFKVTDFPEGLLSSREINKYRKNIKRALQLIDDKIIFQQRMIFVEHLVQIFAMKYDTKPELHFTPLNAEIICGNKHIRTAARLATRYDFITMKDGKLTLEGYTTMVGFPEDAQYRLYLAAGDNYYECELIQRELTDRNCWGRLKQTIGFKGEVPLIDENVGKLIRLCVVYQDHFMIRKNYMYGKFCPICGYFAHQYYKQDGLVLSGNNEGIRVLTEEESQLRELEEIQMLEEKGQLLEYHELEEYGISEYLLLRDIKMALVRKNQIELYPWIVELRKAGRTIPQKPIWMISDRVECAGDNGEAFFRFLMEKEDLPVTPYFVIDAESPDYVRMQEIGPVVAYGSDEHLKLHLQAEVAVSSQGEDIEFNPFMNDRIYFADLLHNLKFVFLQHGITKDDLSKWLCRCNKNISGFVTATKRERQSILDYNYGYSEEVPWLTGFPRFDNMYDATKKQIVLCPTWRLYLRGIDEPRFLESDYFKFYYQVVTNKKLKDVLEKSGYYLVAKFHPNMRNFQNCFETVKYLEILPDEMTYRQVFAESALMITDYSSTAMDFAYIRKPVIYSQFDRNEFFSGKHMYEKGYFDYETDGFGPVTETVEQTVEEIIRLIEKDCQMEQKYFERCEEFFMPRDQNNCQRVYEKICEL